MTSNYALKSIHPQKFPPSQHISLSVQAFFSVILQILTSNIQPSIHPAHNGKVFIQTYFRHSIGNRRQSSEAPPKFIASVNSGWKHSSQHSHRAYRQYQQNRRDWFENCSVEFVFRQTRLDWVEIKVLEVMAKIINLKSVVNKKKVFLVFPIQFIDYKIRKFCSREWSLEGSKKKSIQKLLPSRMKWKIMIDVVFSAVLRQYWWHLSRFKSEFPFIEKLHVISKWETMVSSLTERDEAQFLINYERKFSYNNKRCYSFFSPSPPSTTRLHLLKTLQRLPLFCQCSSWEKNSRST